MLSKCCIGWDVPAHNVIRTKTVEIAEVATVNLCPLCLFSLYWDPYLQGAVEVVDDEDIEGIVSIFSYLTPPKGL